VAELPSDAAQWCAPATAHPSVRLAWLEELADRGALDPEIRAFAARAHDTLAELRATDPAARMLTAVHSLVTIGHYELWPDACDLYQTPRTTFLTLRGDCKAWSSLFVAMCRATGVRARCEWLPQPGEDWDHVSAVVLTATGWQWAEPSIAGARIGEHPYAAAKRLRTGHTAV
jgi:transglutaminase-like putative cysteine protease